MNDRSDQKDQGVYKNRHRSRELALQTLYACDVSTTADWQLMLDRIADTGSLSAEVKKYAQELVREVFNSLENIDRVIGEHAANWEIKRMAAIDRNILRIAVAELTSFGQVPEKVVIDESVVLAKTFGTEDSGKFVNGIIDSIHKKTKKQSGISGEEGSQNGANA